VTAAALFLTPDTVIGGLRYLQKIKFPRTQRSSLMGYLALSMKAAGEQTVRVESFGAESVENQLTRLFGVAPGTLFPLVNPFGTREGRLEYLKPEYARAGVYTHLYPGRTLARLLPVERDGDAQVVHISEDAAAKVAEIKVPLEPTLAFLLRNEPFPANATSQTLVERGKAVLGLTDKAMDDLFVTDATFKIEFGVKQFTNTLTEMPTDLQPPTPNVSHASAAHVSKSMVPVARRSAIQLSVDPIIQRRIRGAFRSSKAIALVGPPGTAKSWMLEDILENAASDPSALGLSKAPQYDRHTAEVDWSARTLIGGHYPQADGRLVWQEGCLLRAIRDGRSLWIDEMNRADLDRTLGPALTFLAGQRVDLGPTHLAEGPDGEPSKSMVLVWADGPDSGVVEDEEQRVYYVGTDWRLLGTYNNTDLGRVFPMGAALTRRWAIVPVAPLAADQLLDVLKQVPNLPESIANLIANAYVMHLPEIPIGPAPFVDMAKYVAENSVDDSHAVTTHLQDAYVLYLGQQLRRLEPESREKFMKALGSTLGHELSDELARA
jgi:MoxR-like ATPase